MARSEFEDQEQDIFEEGREAEKAEEANDLENNIAFDLTPYYFNLEVNRIIDRLSKEKSILIPSFQRNFVWDRTGASLFIDSMLRGLPSPSLFFFEEERQKYLVIDGQQRILTLYYFIKGIFPKEKKHQSVNVNTDEKVTNIDRIKDIFTDDIEGEPFKLIGKVHDQWRNKTFQELSKESQEYLLNTYIYVVNLRQTKPVNDNSSMFLIFERINTGAKPLNAQQIRLCVGHGKFATLIDDYTSHPVWKKFNLTDNEGNISELILRFTAIYFTKDPFKSSMRRFLDTFLAKHRNFSDSLKQPDLESLYQKSLDKINSVFTAKDFSPKDKFNGYMFLSIWLGIASSPDIADKSIREGFDKIKNNSQFKEFYNDTRRAASAKNLYPIIDLVKRNFQSTN